MVQLTRIYTRGGDKGQTSLGSGTRVSKTNLRIHAIGTVDEANASLGWARQYADSHVDPLLSHIQNDLFDVGADLCMPDLSVSALRIHENQVLFLEEKIDQINAHLQPLTSFVLPGGSKISAALHVARTIVRRAERDVVALDEYEKINDHVIKYINRLSDLIFVLTRDVNDKGARDVLWVPGAHRSL